MDGSGVEVVVEGWVVFGFGGWECIPSRLTGLIIVRSYH